MTTAVWYEAGEDYAPAAEVRLHVFVEEQGYTEEEEFDEHDKTCPHLVLFDGETPVATGRLFLLSDGTAKIGRIAVEKAYRGQHLGAKNRHAVNGAFERNGRKTRLRQRAKLRRSVLQQIRIQGIR